MRNGGIIFIIDYFLKNPIHCQEIEQIFLPITYLFKDIFRQVNWFSCLMAYQPLWVIQCQIHPCRTVVVSFNP